MSVQKLYELFLSVLGKTEKQKRAVVLESNVRIFKQEKEGNGIGEEF